jgi:hypothetical protein
MNSWVKFARQALSRAPSDARIGINEFISKILSNPEP